MKVKNLLFASVTLAVLFLVSCIRESENGRMHSYNRLSLSFSVQDTRTASATRSIASEDGEANVENLYLLFFQPSSQKTGMFVDYVKVDGSLRMNVSMDLDLSGTSLSASSAYNILAIANIDGDNYMDGGGDLWTQQWAGCTEAQVMIRAMAYASENNPILSGNLLMSGRVEKAAEDNSISLSLERVVSRFDVINTARNDYDMISVSIWNAYSTASVWGDGVLDYSDFTQRIRRFYSYDNTNNILPEDCDAEGLANDDARLDNILGGLYAFENRVAVPKEFDRNTTCLIVGMKERATGNVTYYRADMYFDGEPQALRRNQAYRLTITGVNGPGAEDEELAYTGKGATLKYAVSLWGLDDNGLMVQDQYSILSIPTKTIRMGRAGGPSTFSIYTFNNTGANPRLAISSQTYEPNDGTIHASLTDNILSVGFDPLKDFETERRGVITLSYAGLETSINIIQSGSAETYLRVFLPDGGIPSLPQYAGMFTGLIRVEASGPWTARLYLSGFSFTQPVLMSDQPVNEPLRILRSTDGLVQDNKFRVFTHSTNTDASMREAFVVITLDSNPEEYISMVHVTQVPTPGVKLKPDVSSLTFNGMKEMIPPTETNVIGVFPSMVSDGSGSEIIGDWEALIDGVVIDGQTVDGNAHFKVSVTKSQTNENSNTIVIEPRNTNFSGSTFTAALTIRLVGDPTKAATVQLRQNSSNMQLLPATVPAVSTAGGSTQNITVDIDPSLSWTASIKTNSGQATDGRRLVKHAATLVDQNGNPIVEGQAYPNTTMFRVVFPKVYYPNRQIPISATVSVKLEGGTLEKDYVVTQTTLVDRGFWAIGIGQGWGELEASGSNYNSEYVGALRAIPSYGFIGNRGNSGNPNLSGNVGGVTRTATYVHVINSNLSATFNWSSINSWTSGNGGILYMNADNTATASLNSFNNTTWPSPLKAAGWADITSSGSSAAVLTTTSGGKKIYDFLMGAAPTRVGSGTAVISSVSGMTADGNSTSVPINGLPSSAVVLMHRSNNTSQAMFVIDPASRIVFNGESTNFNGSSGNRDAFLRNVMFYIGNGARYGSNFTDMFIETGLPGAVPAPWDSYWDESGTGGTDNRGVPSR